jgi:hypothetical protein
MRCAACIRPSWPSWSANGRGAPERGRPCPGGG